MDRNSLDQLTLFNLEPIIEKNTLTQVCNTCDKELPLSYFNTKGKFKEQNKRYSYLDKTCKSCDSIERGERKLREKKYGMPPKNYRCPICERNEKEIKNNLIKVDENRNVVVRDFKYPVWVIDHDHDTGEFRGFLCNSCNTGLGALGDNKKSIKKVLTYLEKAEKNNE
tara:strand:+ start:561 stop:1064 length:504 start_codon:yes stop_codon:yes gene_type:complete